MVLKRIRLTEERTIGELSIVGTDFKCFTLEDAVRAPGVKIAGKTAIPAGLYTVIVTQSPKFKTRLPILLNVPGFEGIRIHAGNTEADTSGCILVGRALGNGATLLESRAALNELVPKIVEGSKIDDGCWIDVRNPETPAPKRAALEVL